MDKQQGNIADAAQALLNGKTLIHSTETVIGLACLANNNEAIQKINSIKNRPDNKSFIILVDSIEMASQYCLTILDQEKELLLSKAPTTVIIKDPIHISKLAIAENNTLAFRITQHPQIIELLKAIKIPLISTSANLSGEPTAKSWKEVDPVILDQVDYSLNLQSDYLTTQSPSRIVQWENGGVKVIRA